MAIEVVLVNEELLCDLNDKNAQKMDGESSGALDTFAGVFTINFKEIEEQLPKEVGPSITVGGAGTDRGTVMKGRVVANI